VNPARPGREQR